MIDIVILANWIVCVAWFGFSGHENADTPPVKLFERLNLNEEEKIEEKPNKVFFAPPTVQVTCGAAKFTENPPRPSDVKRSQKTLVRKERVNPVGIDESSEIKKSFMNGRLVSRISDLDSKERGARAKLKEMIEPRRTLEDKLKKNG